MNIETIEGIKYTKSPKDGRHFVRVDLGIHGENQLLEDFLDLIEIEARKDEPTYPFEEVMKDEFERRGWGVKNCGHY